MRYAELILQGLCKMVDGKSKRRYTNFKQMVMITVFFTSFKGLAHKGVLLMTSLVFLSCPALAQIDGQPVEKLMQVGMARTDITPKTSIRLAGYSARAGMEADKIMHRLEAKALAFGNDEEKPSILITVDLVGIPGNITSYLVNTLSKEMDINEARIAICASHTHGGPEVGNLLNILQAGKDGFGESLLPLDHLLHIAQYTEDLKEKLLEVSRAALKNRQPASLAWGRGTVAFAKNRRTEGGPVDHDLPILVVKGTKGELKAILVSYACHATTIGSLNEVYGDWISEAKINIEKKHPTTMAMVAIGCGGDSNPLPRGKIELMQAYGKQLSDEVERLLLTTLQPIADLPSARMKRVQLPFAHVPSVAELMQESGENSAKGYYSRIALDRVLRGQSIPTGVSYPVQVWTFGKQMAMVNLPGEVVVDYSLRLKRELGAERLWVNAYTNDVPSYIASSRVIAEGGYEADESMYWYNKPSPYKPEIEDVIIQAVHDLLPESF